jgi:hypothetical protein
VRGQQGPPGPLGATGAKGDDGDPGPAKADMGLIEPDGIAYRVELTPAELKLTYSALKALLN